MGSLSKKTKFFSWILVIVLGVSCLCASPQPVKAAAAYQGQGTASSPYLVETADQLNGMRNNLSAHYKLANTIDMSSFGTFEPIGYEGQHFTGSFTCDTNTDGAPRYVIKNLKIYIDAGEKYGHKIGNAASYSDYVEGKNKWQAGLFGYTEGATIKNIALLDAEVTNTVVGQNSTNSDYSVNPGQNSTTQSAGILIGSAIETTVFGCMSSGFVNAKNNNTGGLIGYAVGGSVTNSYSTASVQSSGYWGTGGLIGICDSNLSGCFAAGNVKGGPTETTTGGLIGQIVEGSTIMVVSCYSTGNVSPDATGFSMIGYRTTYGKWREDMEITTQNILNCYTTGNVEGYSVLQIGDLVVENNNFILSSATGRQEYFKAASMDEIKTALAACGDYDVSGSRPVLKNVAMVSDASNYVPGEVSDAVNSQTPDEPGDGDTTDPDGDETPGEVLTQEEITQILKNLKSGIEALPEVEKLTISDYETVMALYGDFERIGEENQEFLKDEYRTKLLDAVEKMESLKKGGQTTVDATISTAELLLIIVLTVLVLLILVFNVIWSVWIIRKYRGRTGKERLGSNG